eukprot:GHVH01001223.1.p1 GENE.GHVH01001223.1~~GHVH01001223.1.p1  ORF type:complete len:154 (-),score=26.10 GHVH01001223.1:458-898(-)
MSPLRFDEDDKLTGEAIVQPQVERLLFGAPLDATKDDTAITTVPSDQRLSNEHLLDYMSPSSVDDIRHLQLGTRWWLKGGGLDEGMLPQIGETDIDSYVHGRSDKLGPSVVCSQMSVQEMKESHALNLERMKAGIQGFFRREYSKN